MPLFDRGMLSFRPGQKRPQTSAQTYEYESRSPAYPDQRPQTSGGVPGERKPALEPLFDRPMTSDSRAASNSRPATSQTQKPRPLPWAPSMPSSNRLRLGRRPGPHLEIADRPKPMHPEHGDCLKLPIGMDRLWLLLPPEKRPLVQQLLPGHETAMETTEAALVETMAIALFGNSGPALLSSLANTAESRPPWTPRKARNRNSLRGKSWQPVPMDPTAPRPATVASEGPWAAAAMKNRTLSPPDSHSGQPRPFNTRWAEVFADQLMLERYQSLMQQENELREGSDAWRRKYVLDIGQWWRQCSARHGNAVLDERCFALAALASHTRPAHLEVLASQVSLENFKILSLWSRLKRIRIDCGDISSIEGVEGLKNLQDVSFLYCEKLHDVTPLGKCLELRTVDLRGCIELRKLGDIPVAEESMEHLSGVFKLSNLQHANLTGCNGLKVEQLVALYSAVHSIVFPNAKLAIQCATKILAPRHVAFTSHVKASAQVFLEETAELVQPPVACSWDKYRTYLAEVIYALQYARSLGASQGSLHAAELKRRQAKLLLHLGPGLSADEKATLMTRGGRKGPARLRRCFVLIKWMKIRRLEGVTRKGFCSVLGKALDEPKHLLSRVYNFMDVEREGVLTQEDFDRLTSGFHGGASTSAVDEFRGWAYEEFGGVQGLFAAIIRVNTTGCKVLAEYVDFWAFSKAVQKLGWKGPIHDIFALLNDHKPKTAHVTVDDLGIFDWLYLSQIAKFKHWMIHNHGSTQAAFKAIDIKNTKSIHFTVFRKYLKTPEAKDLCPGIATEDLERALRLVDYNDSESITHQEFEVLANMDVNKFLEDLSTFRELILIKWGTFYEAFAHISSIKVSDAKAKLGKKARKTKAAGIRFVHFKQFEIAAKELGYKPSHDLRLIFRYLDFNMEGTVVLEDFMVLPVVTVGDTRECFAKVKAYLLQQWGSYQESYSGLCRAAQNFKEEPKDVHENSEGASVADHPATGAAGKSTAGKSKK